MKNNGKRMLSLILSILLLVTLLPQLQFPSKAITEGSCGKKLIWSLSNAGTLTISGSGAMTYFSSASDAPWYSQRASIKEVKIDSGVTCIGYKAFSQCSNLTSVSIPSSVTEIDGYAFYRCTGLSMVTIPNDVTTIGDHAFYGCSNLSTITFSGTAPSFGEACFGNVTAKVFYPCNDEVWTGTVGSNYGGKITWEMNHNRVGGVCTNCQNGQTAKILHSGSCGSNAVWELDELGTLTISGSGSMTDYGKPQEGLFYPYSVFYSYCELITNVVIKQGITRIGNYAFRACSNLVSVTIPGSVASIGNYAFKECSNLKYITYLGSVPASGSASFDGVNATVFHACTSGTSGSGMITWAGHFFNDYAIYEDATCTTNAKATGTCVDCGITTNIEVPGTVTDHKNCVNGVCADCGKTINITFITKADHSDVWGEWGGSALEVYADNVFLTRISHDMGADSNVLNIPYISCQTYVVKWSKGTGYTYGCPFEIWIGNKILVSDYFGNGYDDGTIVYTLKNVAAHRYQALSTAPSCTQEGIAGNTCLNCGLVDVIEAIPATGHSYIETIIPASCTETGSATYTCATCNDSYSITTPASGHNYLDDTCTICQSTQVTEILYSGTCGPNVHWKFDSLGTLTIYGYGPMDDYYSSSTTWSPYGIHQKITGIKIENGVTSIGDDMFRHLFSLNWVTLPETLTSIGDYAFSSCSKLTEVNIPESVTSIGSNAFYLCKGLKSIEIPEGVTSIGGYAFYQCTSLTSVSIPDSVTSIGYDAFYGCSSLKSLTLPEGVTSIGKYAFYDCSSLNSITFNGSAPSIEEWCFYNVTAIAHHPCGDKTWTEATKANYRGNISWITDHSFGEDGLCTECSKAPNLIVTVASSSGESRKPAAIKVYEDGELLDTATIPSGFSYQTAIPYYHDKTYAFHWVTGSSDSHFSFKIGSSGNVLTSGEGSSYSDGQVVYTLEKMLDHTFTSVVTPPTCTEEGFVTKTCLYCGYINITDITPATGHSYDDVIIPPTCIDAGFSSSTCTTCGYTGFIEIPATGHHYDAGGVCVDCSLQFDLTIYMTDTYGDSWNDAAIAVYIDDILLTTVSLSKDLVSCEEKISYVPGSKYTLRWKSGSSDNECGFKITLNSEMLASGLGSNYSNGQLLCTFEIACAHVYETSETPPTCTIDGFTTGTCTICGNSGILDTTPATGHSFVDGVCTVCHQEDAIASGSCGDDLHWRLDNYGTLFISGAGSMDGYSVPEGSEEPDTPWYAHHQVINKVVIENGVTSIGKLAFYNCTNLTEMDISESVISIGSAAFRNCSSLKNVTIPAGVTDIGKIAFYDCTRLTEVTIPDGVNSIGEYIFGKCSNLTTLNFLGAAPSMDLKCFVNVAATAYYPCDNATWNDDSKQSYGGVITWEATHSFGNFIPNQDASCTQDATTTRTCADCGATETTSLPGTAIGHTEEPLSGYAATCTEAGLSDGTKCTVCNEMITTQETIPATGHDYEITVIPGSCTEYGYELHQCLNCNDSFYNHVTLPTGHKYVNGKCECGAVLLEGDINGDGKLNMGDVAKLYAAVRGKVHLDETTEGLADLTGDGKINMGDVAKVAYLVKSTD